MEKRIQGSLANFHRHHFKVLAVYNPPNNNIDLILTKTFGKTHCN